MSRLAPRLAPVNIRAATDHDLDAIRAIAFETGFLGSSMAAIVDDPAIFLRGLEPHLRDRERIAFVTGDDDVTGYAIASTRDMRARRAFEEVSGLFHDVRRWHELTERDRNYIAARITAALYAATGDERHYRMPEGASLHINLLAEERGNGAGSMLIEAVCDELRRRGIDRVHANSYQSERNPTAAFWLRNGFSEYSRVRTSAWARYASHEVVELACFVREL